MNTHIQHKRPRPIRQFTVLAVVTLLLVTAGAIAASRRAGEREAVTDVTALATLIAETVVQPNLTVGVVDGDPEAIRIFDTILHRETSTIEAVRTKVWDATGRIVYSDEPRLIGNTYPIDDEKLEVLADHTAAAEISELDDPDQIFDQSEERLLEVYVPIWGPDGEMLLYEAYFSYGIVDTASSRIWGSFAPILLTSLVGLAFTQWGLGWLTTKRLRREQVLRENLLQRAVDASQAERRAIAGDLHDGVVQGLVSVSFGLSAASQRGRDPSQVPALLDTAAAGVRRSIRSLRSLMVDIYPPNLHRLGLKAALTDLLESLDREDLETVLSVQDDLALDESDDALVFRVVQEAVRNSIRHASPTEIRVSIAADEIVTVAVTDNGLGFDTSTVGESSLGLRLMRDLATARGGNVAIRSAPGSGTTITITLPFDQRSGKPPSRTSLVSRGLHG